MDNNIFEKTEIFFTDLELDNCTRIKDELIENIGMHTKEYREIVKEEIKLLEKKKRIFDHLT